MSQNTDILWNNANFFWNANPYIWNTAVFIIQNLTGGPAEVPKILRDQFQNLKPTTKSDLIRLYVETFKDYMDPESKRLAEAAGIRMRFNEERTKRKGVSITAKERGATVPLVEVYTKGTPLIITTPKITLQAFMELLDIDIK